jgi:hypothetical protein
VVGVENQLIALGVSHDHVAAVRSERAPHEAARHREPDVFQLAPEVLGEELGEAVLETFAALIAEGHICRIGADPESRLRDQVGRLRRSGRSQHRRDN